MEVTGEPVKKSRPSMIYWILKFTVQYIGVRLPGVKLRPCPAGCFCTRRQASGSKRLSSLPPLGAGFAAAHSIISIPPSRQRNAVAERRASVPTRQFSTEAVRARAAVVRHITTIYDGAPDRQSSGIKPTSYAPSSAGAVDTPRSRISLSASILNFQSSRLSGRSLPKSA